MRRAEHDRLMREKDRTIARLERQNQELLDRLTYALTPERPWTPPPEPEPPAVDVYQHEDPDLPGYTSNADTVGI